jgi:uncharacterized radical SAM protein YgiQ
LNINTYLCIIPIINTLPKLPLDNWLPLTRDEMLRRGWNQPDVILISGDAYVDHPAFGTAVIGRVIESLGYKVVIVAQPNWQDDLRDFRKYGRPRLCFAVSSGNMDSMVNHYTANIRLRSDDAYTPGGKAGFRPDYATTVYTKLLRSIYPDIPVIIGGIEASMRRLTHYDYWRNTLLPSILADSGADLLLYGMAEKALKEVLTRLNQNQAIRQLTDIPQTVFRCITSSVPKHTEWKTINLPSHEKCLTDKVVFAMSFKNIEQESNRLNANRLVQEIGQEAVVVNPPYPPLATGELDAVYDLPYTRLPHPRYVKRGVIPAYEMIRHSITIHRGCFGGCAFCTISAHQGKFVASRSEDSILNEVDAVTRMPDFKGYISDLGGPSANMYRMKGNDLALCVKCSRPSCIHPSICPNLNIDHKPLARLYKQAAARPEVKKVIVSSGVRYDMLLARNPSDDARFGLTAYTRQLVANHVSGRLKVAPEHTSDEVLKIMRKPSFKLFEEFRQKFDTINRECGLQQQLIPYFISSHPGSKIEDMAHLAAETKDMGFKLEQVQDLTPTPMTLASVIYYSGIHPFTGKPVFTARTKEEKLAQHRFFFWYKPENQLWIKSSLQRIGRADLVQKLLGKTGNEKRY